MNANRTNRQQPSTDNRPEPSRRPLLQTAVAVGVAAVVAAPAQAGERLLLPAVNMARGEVAQLNLTLGSPPEPVRPESCSATLGFVDGAGAPILDAAGLPVTLEVTLMPDETKSFTLASSLLFADPGGLRRLFRPTVVLSDPPDPVMPDPCANTAASLEVFDARTGRTRFVMGDPIPTEADPPNPIMPRR